MGLKAVTAKLSENLFGTECPHNGVSVLDLLSSICTIQKAKQSLYPKYPNWSPVLNLYLVTALRSNGSMAPYHFPEQLILGAVEKADDVPNY